MESAFAPLLSTLPSTSTALPSAWGGGAGDGGSKKAKLDDALRSRQGILLGPPSPPSGACHVIPFLSLVVRLVMPLTLLACHVTSSYFTVHTCRYEGLAEDHEFDSLMDHLGALEKKDELVNKMDSVTKLQVTTVQPVMSPPQLPPVSPTVTCHVNIPTSPNHFTNF